MVTLELQVIEQFRESVCWLDESSQLIFDRFAASPEFKRGLFTCIERCKDMAERLGAAKVTIKG